MVAKINSGSIFWLLPLNIVLMSMSMYNIEIVSTSKCNTINLVSYFFALLFSQLLHDLVNLSFQLIYMACSMFWPFLHCYYASSITEQIGETALTAYASNWFDLHTNLRKFVVLMMIRSQQTLNFTGLDIIYCTMETLGQVLNSFSNKRNSNWCE